MIDLHNNLFGVPKTLLRVGKKNSFGEQIIFRTFALKNGFVWGFLDVDKTFFGDIRFITVGFWIAFCLEMGFLRGSLGDFVFKVSF